MSHHEVNCVFDISYTTSLSLWKGLSHSRVTSPCLCHIIRWTVYLIYHTQSLSLRKGLSHSRVTSPCLCHIIWWSDVSHTTNLLRKGLSHSRVTSPCLCHIMRWTVYLIYHTQPAYHYGTVHPTVEWLVPVYVTSWGELCIWCIAHNQLIITEGSIPQWSN